MRCQVCRPRYWPATNLGRLVGNVCDASATCQQCRVKSPIFCWQGKCADAVTWALYYENSQKCKEKITNKLLKDLFINIVMSMTCISNILPLKHIIWSVWYLFTGKYASMSRHVSLTCRDVSVWHVIWTLQLTCQLPTFPTKPPNCYSCNSDIVLAAVETTRHCYVSNSNNPLAAHPVTCVTYYFLRRT